MPKWRKWRYHATPFAKETISFVGQFFPTRTHAIMSVKHGNETKQLDQLSSWCKRREILLLRFWKMQFLKDICMGGWNLTRLFPETQSSPASRRYQFWLCFLSFSVARYPVTKPKLKNQILAWIWGRRSAANRLSLHNAFCRKKNFRPLHFWHLAPSCGKWYFSSHPHSLSHLREPNTIWSNRH